MGRGEKMLRKFGRIMEKWGHYLLALLCAGVILLSALWTRREQSREIPDARAHSDLSQQLADVTPIPPGLARPAPGRIVDGMHLSPAFYPRYSLWRIHSGIDFAAEPGTEILAMENGLVTETEGMIEITQEDGRICRYYGAAEKLVTMGQQVKRGEKIGLAGETVHGETGCICVVLLQDGKPVDFSVEIIDKTENKS